MQTYNNQFEDELRKLIDEDIAEKALILTNGAGINDHADYLKIVGEIAGYRNVLELCDAVNTKLSQR